MKKLIALFIVALSIPAMAQNPYPVDNAIVFDHYNGVVKQVPYDVEVCKRICVVITEYA